MLDWIYEWIKNICFYMILMSAVLKALPGKTYEKYIQFFSSVVLILLLSTPIFRLSGVENTISEIYQNHKYLQEKNEIEMMEKYFQEVDLLDFLPDKYSDTTEEESNGTIEIAPVEVGE